jgi:hypothetical protein
MLRLFSLAKSMKCSDVLNQAAGLLSVELADSNRWKYVALSVRLQGHERVANEAQRLAGSLTDQDDRWIMWNHLSKHEKKYQM